MSKNASTVDTKIDIRKLSLINDFAKLGTNGVADNLGMLAGEDAEMEVTKTSFVDVADLPQQLDDETRVGIRVRLRDPPGGHILVLFPERSAQIVTRLMLSDMVESADQVSSEMARSAVEELGNMMASGFIDGWADAMGTSIDISTPQLVYAPASKVVERTAGLESDGLALIFDSEIDVPNREIEAEIYAFPDLEAFVHTIRNLET